MSISEISKPEVRISISSNTTDSLSKLVGFFINFAYNKKVISRNRRYKSIRRMKAEDITVMSYSYGCAEHEF